MFINRLFLRVFFMKKKMNEQNTNNNERKHFKRTNGLNNVNSDLNKHLKLAQNVPNKKNRKQQIRI